MDKKKAAKKKVHIQDLKAKNLSKVKGGVISRSKHDTAKNAINNVR